MSRINEIINEHKFTNKSKYFSHREAVALVEHVIKEALEKAAENAVVQATYMPPVNTKYRYNTENDTCYFVDKSSITNTTLD